MSGHGPSRIQHRVFLFGPRTRVTVWWREVIGVSRVSSDSPRLTPHRYSSWSGINVPRNPVRRYTGRVQRNFTSSHPLFGWCGGRRSGYHLSVRGTPEKEKRPVVPEA